MEPQKKLKILYIITKSNFGGAQRYVYDLATNTKNMGFEPVVAFGGSGPLKERLEAAGVPTISIPTLDRDIGVFKECQAFANIVKIIYDIKPDLIHLNSSKVGILGALAARFFNLHFSLLNLLHVPCSMFHVRIIFTAHGWAFKEKRRFAARKLIEYGSWLTIALSHKTIVVSLDDMEKIKHFVFVRPKIHLVHNGIATPNFSDRTEARKTISEKIGRNIPSDTLLVGTIAELHKNKGLDYAVEAMKTVPDYFYVIIGDGENKENLKKRITEAGLDQKVFLSGQIENAASLLKAFDVFLLSSLKEGLPYALLEAGFAGLSVVATNVGGVPEIVDDMRSGIVIRSKRPKEITEALVFLIDHPEKRKEFGVELARTVAENFTLERMVKETVATYESV